MEPITPKLSTYKGIKIHFLFPNIYIRLSIFFMQPSKTDKRVVSIKDRVGGKTVLEKLSVWTRLLETLEYMGMECLTLPVVQL